MESPLLYTGTCSTAHFAFPGTSVQLPLGCCCREICLKVACAQNSHHSYSDMERARQSQLQLLGYRAHTHWGRGAVNIFHHELFHGELKQFLFPTTQPLTHQSPEVAELSARKGNSTNTAPSSPSLPAFHSQGGAACTHAEMHINASACVSKTAQKDTQNSEVQLIF